MKTTKQSPKVIILTAASCIVVSIALYLLILVPIYSLVGDTTKTDEQIDQTLRRASLAGKVLYFVGMVCFIVIFVQATLRLISYFKNRKKRHSSEENHSY